MVKTIKIIFIDEIEFKIPENLKTLFLPTGKKIQGKVKYLLIGQINVPINYNKKIDWL